MILGHVVISRCRGWDDSTQLDIGPCLYLDLGQAMGSKFSVPKRHSSDLPAGSRKKSQSGNWWLSFAF